MYKLLIVDDEEYTREGLKRFVPWNELGIGEIFEAANGEEAMAVFTAARPDILLCDVRMPRMDGIALSERVRSLDSDCRIVFLSGFSDKEYLKSAIRVGAVDYIEKPVNLDELRTVINNAVTQLDALSERVRQQEVLEKRVAESAGAARQELVSLLVTGLEKPDSLASKFEGMFGFPMNRSGYTAAVLLLNRSNEAAGMDVERIKRDILSRLNSGTLSNINSEPSGTLQVLGACSIEAVSVAAIFQGALSPEQTGEKAVKELLLSSVKAEEHPLFTFSIGVGEPAASPDRIPHSYHTALQAAGKQFFRGPGRVFFCRRNPSSGDFRIEEELFRDYEKALLETRQKDVLQLLDRLELECSRYEAPDINTIKDAYLKLFQILAGVSEKMNCELSLERNPGEYFWMEISGFHTLTEVSGWLRGKTDLFFAAFQEEEASTRKVREIIRFIRQNYQDKNLSVSRIADEVHLSLNYLCRMFKNATGKTVNDFIAAVRMEEACELLKDSDIKLYEVCGRVGFEDANYFSRVFKQHMGMSPSVYREKNIL